MAVEVQVPIIYAGVNGLLDRVPVDKIGAWEKSFKEHLQSSQQGLLAEVNKGTMTPELDAQIKKVVQEHVGSFVSA
ncbi:Alpha subunit of the F1 sector of mitochondrial F1F0 ATP synthase [Rhodotorula kratochvilovae]